MREVRKQLSEGQTCVQMASGNGVDSLHSVAKQSPKSHPIHLTPHLSTVQEEDDVEMTDQADTSGPAAGQAESVLSHGQPTAAEQQGGVDDIDIPQPLPEDLQQAEAFQVGFSCSVVLCFIVSDKQHICLDLMSQQLCMSTVGT